MRRKFVLAAVGAAFALTAVVAATAGGATTKPNPGLATLAKINHIVVIYEENHSFDNLYGLFPGANGIAQAQALMQGKTAEAARGESAPTASQDLDRDVLARHRSFPGNRPSTTLVLERLTPSSLGALIALYDDLIILGGATSTAELF